MGKGLNSGGQEKAMWMLVIFLAVDLPREVDVKGWGVLLGGKAIFMWVVDTVQYCLCIREGTGFEGKMLDRDQRVSYWSVWGVMPV